MIHPMKNPLPLILFVTVALFIYLIFDNLWGVSNKWATNEVLSLWQVVITALGFIAAVIMVRYAAIQFIEGRRKEEQARNESLSQIRYSLRLELETNLTLLRGNQFKIWSESLGVVFLVRPLKTSAFELLAGREDLKYLKPPEALTKIAEAYDQIKDFNLVLNSWFNLWTPKVLHEEEKGHRFFPDTTMQLDKQKKKTAEKIELALKILGGDSTCRS